ncbi:ANTAR domain-containing protein [Colwellia sp. MB3u-28]|nr:ANTAR domain-containing protein [Colwellia sp. MB02u-7]MBA6236428.1 ANTAR domain-containing protein [Colwellia sp. MB02u-11]MBA6256962.1 ANTAR domain-containing protein [Colwellia sp. MB3u-28]MBA6261032.1 ANTAR domain-containing protein [Colwellia sp. MB3u-41]MBA6298172.1 ANTAR domain-containing protein [Colwellia sp. MB3u-22]MBA6303909.1 ANTAR domain-containing protein [Colwellia sp. MB02u-14]MBA6312003.1 ANTAR domain-containing protein [Colwellia sp. MB3u-64]
MLSSSKISNKNQDITAKLKVLLAENNPIKAKALMSILSNAEYDIYHIAHSGVPLLRDVEQLNPDVIIIDIESPNRDMLENLNQISQFAPKPIIVFSEQQNTHTTINQMVKSGVSAYVVGEVNQTRVKSIIDVAIARFEVFQGLKRELADTKQKLSSQKNIDKAKRWLMETKQLSEIDAYHFIRKIAMDNSQKMDDVAKNILSVASIF